MKYPMTSPIEVPIPKPKTPNIELSTPIVSKDSSDTQNQKGVEVFALFR